MALGGGWLARRSAAGWLAAAPFGAWRPAGERRL
jgi:hypothetical protein